MKIFIQVHLILLIITSGINCKTTGGKDLTKDVNIRYKTPDKYNFIFVGYNIKISDPENDRRSFYKIFIDKIENGRTTTGLESQEKKFTGNISINKHLLHIEKWILNKKLGKYVKLNNIDQPKPNFFYFATSTDKIVKITMKSKKNGKAKYNHEYEGSD